MSHYLIRFAERKQVKSDVWVVLLTVERDGELCGEAEVALSREGPRGLLRRRGSTRRLVGRARHGRGDAAAGPVRGRATSRRGPRTDVRSPCASATATRTGLANCRPPLVLLPEGSVVREFELADA